MSVNSSEMLAGSRRERLSNLAGECREPGEVIAGGGAVTREQRHRSGQQQAVEEQRGIGVRVLREQLVPGGVEVDAQQVNLTQFSLFFPEKREFFLEGRGFFGFATFPTTGSGGGGGGGASTSTTPLLFYSRRIGLAAARQVPIWGGGRLTGRMGRYQFGVVNMQTKEDQAASAPSTNFSVVRVKRDILRRSSIGVLATSRSKSQDVAGSMSHALGVDGTFAFFTNLTVATYYAQTRNDRAASDNSQASGTTKKTSRKPVRGRTSARRMGR